MGSRFAFTLFTVFEAHVVSRGRPWAFLWLGAGRCCGVLLSDFLAVTPGGDVVAVDFGLLCGGLAFDFLLWDAMYVFFFFVHSLGAVVRFFRMPVSPSGCCSVPLLSAVIRSA